MEQGNKMVQERFSIGVIICTGRHKTLKKSFPFLPILALQGLSKGNYLAIYSSYLSGAYDFLNHAASKVLGIGVNSNCSIIMIDTALSS